MFMACRQPKLTRQLQGIAPYVRIAYGFDSILDPVGVVIALGLLRASSRVNSIMFWVGQKLFQPLMIAI